MDAGFHPEGRETRERFPCEVLSTVYIKVLDTSRWYVSIYGYPLFNQYMKKDIVLMVATPPKAAAKSTIEFQELWDEKLRFFLVTDKEAVSESDKETYKLFDEVLFVNFDSDLSMSKALAPYRGNILVATCRSESNMPKFKKIIPHIPYVKTPLPSSIAWSIDKLEMRRRFNAFDPKITPKYMLVEDATHKTINRVEEKIGFPLIVKPTGLASSLLVTIAYHHEELEKVLKNVFRKVNILSKQFKGNEQPKVLVEQFMEGSMYSIDAYVSSKGTTYFCPMVSVKTGKEAGFDDFFGYQQMTPTRLKTSSIEEARSVTEKAIHALGLRSTTAHVELMRTEDGWKVIEVGPRIGGFRHTMYELSYGINHTANDILIRIPRKPKIPRKILGYTSVFKIFSKNPGIITTLKGVKKIKELSSFISVVVNKKVGDRTYSASNGGKSVFNVTLFNEDRPKLLADIRRMEKMIEIKTMARKKS